MSDSVGERFKWWQSEMLHNLILKQKVFIGKVDNLEKGCDASNCRISDEEMPSKVELRKVNAQMPVITIKEDEAVDKIEMAQIESYFERILTPEGNVKYKNYRILAPAPSELRMYSPSGDINMTPKKGKMVPKFDIFHPSLFPRDKLLALIHQDHFGSEELKAIIKPPEMSRRASAMIRNTAKSSMDDRLEFLSSIFSPSTSSLSILSEDSVYLDRYATPSPNPEIVEDHFLKSRSKDIEEMSVDTNRFYHTQCFSPCREFDYGHNMNLSEELKQAENICRSYKPRKMTDFEFSYFHRAPSSLLNQLKKSENNFTTEKPRESKKMIIRSFIRNDTINRAAHRDKLAKLALAIEEDSEYDFYDLLSSARQLEDRIESMLDETKDLRSEMIEIQEDIQDDYRKVSTLIIEAKALTVEIRALNYLEDIISLLKGNLEAVAHKDWPFAGTVGGRKRDPNANLVV